MPALPQLQSAPGIYLRIPYFGDHAYGALGDGRLRLQETAVTFVSKSERPRIVDSLQHAKSDLTASCTILRRVCEHCQFFSLLSAAIGGEIL